MSIATRIESMTNNLSNTYDSLEDLGIELDSTNKNLENLPLFVNNIYQIWPKVSNEIISDEIVLNNTKKGKMVLQINGNTYQDQFTEETENNNIENVAGNVQILIHNKNFFNAQDSIILGKQLDQNNEIINDTNGFYQASYTRVKPNTEFAVRGGDWLKILSYNKQKELLNFQQLRGNLTKFSAPDNCYYIRVSGSQSLSLNNNLQIEEGNTQTDFEEYEGVILPFSLTHRQRIYDGDYLADDGIHHVKARYVFKGTAHFTKSSMYKGSFFLGWGSFPNSQARAPFLCSHLKYATTASEYSIGKCLSDGSCNLWLGDENEFPDLAAFQAKLKEQYKAGTPITIEYPLAQEEIEPYTQIQQEQYNAIKQAKSYNGITHIFSMSDELGFKIEATALKKIN